MTDSVPDDEQLGVEDEVLEEAEAEGAEDEDQSGEAESNEPESGEDDPEGPGGGTGAAAATEIPTEGGDGVTPVLDLSAGVPSEETEVGAVREEMANLKDRHLRLAAEFNNFRRRSEQERLSVWSRAQADLVAKFVDVLDDLHRVAELDLTNATVEAIMEGIDLVEKKFVRVLEDSSVEMMDPMGQPFDPEVMEAMMRVPAESSDQLDTVAQVFQKGYSLQGVLVRPARVSVYTEG